MAAELGKAIFTLSADDSQLDAKLKSAEGKVEQASARINTKMVAMSAAIGAALGTVLGGYVQRLLSELQKIPDFFIESFKVTAEYGAKMADLGTQMGMTATQAAVLTGILERQGVGAGIAARSMQMMASQIRQTQEALDPFQTRMGKLLGTLRDSSGNALGTAEVLDLVRQRIQAASSDTEKLTIAQQLLGIRMGGQMLTALKSTNEEWEKQKKSVENAIGPMDVAAEEALKYKEATAALDQVLRGIQVSIGTAVLPALTSLIEKMQEAAKFTKDLFHNTELDPMKQLSDALVERAAQARLSEEKKAAVAADNERREQQITKLVEERVSLTEKMVKLGVMDSESRRKAALEEIEQLSKQRALLEQNLGKVGNSPAEAAIRLDLETQIFKTQVQAAEVTSRMATEEYQNEELRAKALGMLNSTTEIQLLTQKLSDARIEGDERLRIEADLFQRKQRFAEEAVKLARQLGFMQIQEELKFRAEKAKDMLSRGDVLGAAGEMKQIKDLQMKEADESLAFIKKIHITSIQSEIDYQKQKLEAVKGSAQDERNVLMSIADLDKQLYDKRLEYAMNYTKGLQSAGKAVLGASTAGESSTPEQARIEAERQNTEAGREARSVAEHGGTDEQREAAIAWAQTMKKQVEETAALGEKLSSRMEESWDTAKAVFTAFGVKNVADPTGPSASVGSALSQTEGLATANLARGSQIPNLDTSYTDLAIRIRDVFLGTIPNITSFSDALKQATAKLAGTFGNPINTPPGGGSGPGGIQFGPGSSQEALSSGPSSTAQPPSAGFGTLTRSFGPSSAFGSSTETVGGSSLAALPELQALTKTLQDHITTQKEISQKLQNATEALNKAADFTKRVQVDVGVDPNSQEGFKAVSREATAESIRQ